MVERTFAHAYETGALRRLYVRGKQNVQKRLLLRDDGSGYATSTSRRGGPPIFILLRLISAINAMPVTSRWLAACISHQDTASRSMCSTGNSMPEIAALGTGC